MNIEELKKLKEALETGVDLAIEQVNYVTEAYKGYKPEKHQAAAFELAVMKDALALVSTAAEKGMQGAQAVDEEALLGAVARGWCSPENAHKEMDSTLAQAIAAEVRALLAAQPVAITNNPHTGQPRDPRDIASDPRAILCVEPGKPLHAAPVASKEAVSELPFPDAWTFEQRIEAATMFLAPYSDTNMDRLLDYEVQPIVRKLTAMIGQWQQTRNERPEPPAATEHAAPTIAAEGVPSVVPDWPFCNPGCDYEDPHGGRHDERSKHCSCDAAKASIARQHAAQEAAKPSEGSGDAIARSKRILARVDDYVQKPTGDNRHTLRCALHDEFTAALAQPAEPGGGDVLRKALGLCDHLIHTKGDNARNMACDLRPLVEAAMLRAERITK